MSNAIVLFKKYTDMLDEVYKVSSLTSKLDSDSSLAKQVIGTNEIIIPVMTMDGLADYSRDSGYVSGNVGITYETVPFNYDRGRKFNVDAMDEEETAGLAFGKLSAEFIRTKVVPEMDAFRFASYASADGVSKAAPALLDTGKKVILALRDAVSKMDEDEVPFDERELFITPALLGLIEDLDTTVSRAILNQFASITKVPQNRFYSAVDLLDGSSGDELAGGYKKADGALNINFMVIDKNALMQYQKHVVNKVISPDANQNSDSWLFFYRAYGLVDVYKNKASGIYLHCSVN